MVCQSSGSLLTSTWYAPCLRLPAMLFAPHAARPAHCARRAARCEPRTCYATRVSARCTCTFCPRQALCDCARTHARADTRTCTHASRTPRTCARTRAHATQAVVMSIAVYAAWKREVKKAQLFVRFCFCFCFCFLGFTLCLTVVCVCVCVCVCVLHSSAVDLRMGVGWEGFNGWVHDLRSWTPACPGPTSN